MEKYNSTFENPVPVGSVLYLTATVAYTEPPHVNRSLGGDGVEDAADSHEERYTRVQVRVDSKQSFPNHYSPSHRVVGAGDLFRLLRQLF